MSRPNLQVPTLNMLSENNVKGPDPAIIAKVSVIKMFTLNLILFHFL